MKLRNKKTGETGYYLHTHRDHKDGHIKVAVLKDGKPFSEFKPYEPIYDYDSLAELNSEWEDAPEEPKGSALDLMILTLINFIENEPDEDKVDLEDCKQALDKLRAWKRLKDKGFKTEGWTIDDGLRVSICTNLNSDGIYDEGRKETKKDLDICFGGEE